MMKKFLLVVFLVAVLLVASFSLAMAKSGQVKPESEINAVEGGDDDKDGGKGGAYCSSDKIHPAAYLLAGFYADQISNEGGISEDDLAQIVENAICGVNSEKGLGVGQVALALATEKVNNEGLVCDGSENEDPECIDYSEVLALREGGKGWGNIWKEDYKLKGKEAEKHLAPGQTKKDAEDDGEVQETETDSKNENKTHPEQGKANGKNKGDDHPNQGKGKGPKKTE